MRDPMRDPLKQKRDELLAFHRANGFVDVRQLAEKTLIVVKSLEEVYELEVGTPKFGVVLIASNGRFERREKVIVMGCMEPVTRIFIPETICQDMRMVLRPRKGSVIRTQPIVYARIKGKTYDYELWRE